MKEVEKYMYMYKYKKFKCPCCGNYYDTPDFGDDVDVIGEICPICFWHHDPIGEEYASTPIGPNKVSLMDARKNYQEFKASEKRFITSVRAPLVAELPENNE